MRFEIRKERRKEFACRRVFNDLAEKVGFPGAVYFPPEDCRRKDQRRDSLVMVPVTLKHFRVYA